MCLHTILVDPGNPQRLWVAASAIGVFRSEDGGISWKTCNRSLPLVPTGLPAETEVCRCVHKMVLDPHRLGVLYQQEGVDQSVAKLVRVWTPPPKSHDFGYSEFDRSLLPLRAPVKIDLP